MLYADIKQQLCTLKNFSMCIGDTHTRQRVELYIQFVCLIAEVCFKEDMGNK